LKRKVLPLLILIGIAIIAGGFLFLEKVTLLHIENMDRQKTIHIRIGPSESFSLFYIHSIYRESVMEEFQVDHQAIILKGVRTKSPAIMEYYGFQESDEFHPMDLKLGAVFLIRRGMGEGQGLIVRDRKIYLSEIGQKGDRIQLRVEFISLGEYLFASVWKYH
jgi:hypothetical protein